jgi:hypothetical protein
MRLPTSWPKMMKYKVHRDRRRQQRLAPDAQDPHDFAAHDRA